MHPHDDSPALKVMDLQDLLFTPVRRGKNNFGPARSINNKFRAFIDIAVGVTADHNRLLPCAHGRRYVLKNNRFSEDSAVQYRTDRTVWALPLLLQAIFLHPRGIWGDRGALHPDPGLLDRLGSIN